MASIANLLPVGSVVTLKGGTKRLAIMGILVGNKEVRYDYIAVPSPEGFIDEEHTYLFNHEDIGKVEYLGYINTEYQLFRGTLAKNYKPSK